MKQIEGYLEYNADNPPVTIQDYGFSFYGNTNSVMAVSFNIVLEDGEIKPVSIPFEPDGIMYEVAEEHLDVLKKHFAKSYTEIRRKRLKRV